MNNKTTGIVAYITLIGLVIALCAGSKEEEAKFHVNQALVLMLAGIAAGIAVGIISFVLGMLDLAIIASLISGVVSIAQLVLWIMGIVNAANGNQKELPIIGGLRLYK